MTSVLNSLMTGGYEPDNEMDLATDFDLWVESIEEKAKKMSNEELEFEIDWAKEENDYALASIYEDVLSKRPNIDVPLYSTLADEPYYQDDIDRLDRRKEYLEDYCPIEQDELPF